MRSVQPSVYSSGMGSRTSSLQWSFPQQISLTNKNCHIKFSAASSNFHETVRPQTLRLLPFRLEDINRYCYVARNYGSVNYHSFTANILKTWNYPVWKMMFEICLKLVLSLFHLKTRGAPHHEWIHLEKYGIKLCDILQKGITQIFPSCVSLEQR